MPEPSIEIEGASIILNGSFNPRIFQPEWFARQKLISREEAEQSTLEIIHSQVSQFATERFIVVVTPDRFQLQNQPNCVTEPVRDLVLGTFFILEHTPIQTMGVNRHLHFALGTEDAWHQLGDRLAPKDVWTQFSGVRPGLRALQILYSAGSADKPSITVQVEPSVSVKFGAYFGINYHYTARPSGEPLNDMLKSLKN